MGGIHNGFVNTAAWVSAVTKKPDSQRKYTQGELSAAVQKATEAHRREIAAAEAKAQATEHALLLAEERLDEAIKAHKDERFAVDMCQKSSRKSRIDLARSESRLKKSESNFFRCEREKARQEKNNQHCKNALAEEKKKTIFK